MTEGNLRGTTPAWNDAHGFAMPAHAGISNKARGINNKIEQPQLFVAGYYCRSRFLPAQE